MLQAFNKTRDRWLAVELELAQTFLTRLRGLMGKADLAPGQGLWIKPCDSIHTLGMRFPIDVVFLNRHGQVVKTVEQLRSGRVILPVAGAASVLELPAGMITQTGTQAGDMIALTEAGLGSQRSEVGSERVHADSWLLTSDHCSQEVHHE